mmetsp:Transcript_9699/g.20703  ORF Transcript_9699/g.20703 Transcript_9699/m.20703 type:complete len:147 (-) Transcript_9699:68-508(-)
MAFFDSSTGSDGAGPVELRCAHCVDGGVGACDSEAIKARTRCRSSPFVAVFGPQCIAPVAPLALRLLSRCSHSGSPPSSDILVLNRLASPFDVVCDDSPSDTDETDDTMQQKRSTHVDGGEGEIVGLFFHHDVGARRCPTLGDRPR